MMTRGKPRAMKAEWWVVTRGDTVGTVGMLLTCLLLLLSNTSSSEQRNWNNEKDQRDAGAL
jgi:hypothetical protein